MTPPTPSSELRRHWRRLVGCFLGFLGGASSAYFYTAGIFLKPLAAEFGWSRATASLGPLLGILFMGLCSPFAGKLIDRFGARRVGLLSFFGLALSFFLLGSTTAGLTSFLAITCVLAILGIGTTAIGFSRILVASFHAQRGLAIGIAYAGTGLGAIIAPLVVGPAISAYGWRQSYFGLAAFELALIPILALLLRDGDDRDPALAHSQAAPAEAAPFTSPHFVLLSLIFFLVSTGVFGSIVHIVPMLTDRGYGVARAASTASILGVAVILARMATGFLLDRIEAARLSMVVFCLTATGLVLLASGSGPVLVAGIVLLGFGIGSEFDLAAFLVGRHFELRHYGAIFGGIYLAVSMGGALGPFLAGVIHDRSGGYPAWLYLAAGSLLLAAVACAFLSTRSAGPRRSRMRACDPLPQKASGTLLR